MKLPEIGDTIDLDLAKKLAIELDLFKLCEHLKGILPGAVNDWVFDGISGVDDDKLKWVAPGVDFHRASLKHDLEYAYGLDIHDKHLADARFYLELIQEECPLLLAQAMLHIVSMAGDISNTPFGWGFAWK